jgi:schlafen family protein
MARFFYSDSVADFLARSPEEILGVINATALTTAEAAQQNAWLGQVNILKSELLPFGGRGNVFFEFSVPRIGKRIDVVLVLDGVIFVLEFKVGEDQYRRSAIEQVWDYALDLKNFHDTSHDAFIAPVLVATAATSQQVEPQFSARDDNVLMPMLVAPVQLGFALGRVLALGRGAATDTTAWHEGRYRPTPTIIEAARALYAGHSVEDISARGAEAKNLSETSDAVVALVHKAHQERKKTICFVTGVPGAGKTLVGLNISNTRLADAEGKAVYLSGNGPLVKVLQEALAIDSFESSYGTSQAVTKAEARRAVSSFIQNVHHFRDAYIDDKTAPHNHISIFDEAQRAWDLTETQRFMKEKKGIPNFGMSEPEFLISCMDRHDWAVVVCLVGGGQEINRGEAGISGWINALIEKFPNWRVCVSPELTDSEYAAGAALKGLRDRGDLDEDPALHLAISMRSFRAGGLSDLIKRVLDLDAAGAKQLLREIEGRYPIVLTRSVRAAKEWVRQQARGSERFGMMVSSQAQRLKPLAIDVRVSTNPVHWFLKGKDDVRSSFYLEDVATEFDVQGLELDWSCVVWDGDFRYSNDGWVHSSFRGNRWEKISKLERQAFQKNAYRVLLTRARQGMAIVVPEGDESDKTRLPALYDETYAYLASLGMQAI